MANVELFKLTYTAFMVNHLLDTGKYDDVTIDELGPHLENETIFQFLTERFGDELPLGILTGDDRLELAAEWASLWNAVDAGRKFAVRRNGVCLLLAYVIESIQQRALPN